MKLDLTSPERSAKCRVCNEDIPKGASAVMATGFPCRGGLVNYWMHKHCFTSEATRLLEEIGFEIR